MIRGLPTSLASVLTVLVLTVLLNIPAQSPFHAIAEASGDDTAAAPGLCEDGYVAPTPVSVTVSAVPIVVQSTTADYFVLYIDHPDTGNHGNPNKIAISVTRGEEGSTTLPDNLRALAPGKYRVEKYQVARPGDIDGDCVDDITELDDLGNYNPLNPATKLDISKGQTAIASREAFETLSYQAARVPDNLERLDGLEFVKFSILNWYRPNPSVYFQNNNNIGIHRELIAELDKLGVEKLSLLIPLHGTIVYHPNAIAPDGSLGVYGYNFDLSYRPFKETAHLNQLLASAMPFLENELAYYPSVYNQHSFKDYKTNKDKYDKSRVNIILAEDVLPDVDFIPLNQAEGYGRLRLMEDGNDPRPGDIPIYESLPNDLPRVAGSITTVPQTPLSHVNLRAIQNGVPNAFLRDILKTKKYKDLIGKHVYFAVTADGFTLRAATKAEVDAHHRKSRPTTAQTLTRDLTVTSITPLSGISFNDWDAFGVKAANMAELSKLNLPTGTVPTGYAVPFYFYDEFMKANGFYNDVDTMLADTDFQSDYSEQEDQLKKLRKKIKNGTTPDWIIKALEKMHATYPDGTSLRYRSSTNNEDLPAFNGAGLYSSKTQDPEETTKDGIDKSIKAVWASLWNYRAFLERDYYRVDHKSVAMGVLVHPNYSDELANGVAVSHDPISFLSNMYYVNTQIGEDLVTNPEAKSYPEQLLLDSKGKAGVLTRSNHAKRGQLLMSDAQMVQLRNNLQTIHDRFAKLYDVKAGDQFAIEIEFKITAGNKLAIKQARPWVFADTISLKPLVSASFASTKVTEGSPLNLVLTRRGGVLSDPLDVDLIWTDPAGKIQGAAPTSVQFLSGKTSSKVTAPTILTNNVETDSVITVRIKAKSSYVVVGETEVTATVVDNAVPTPEVSITGGAGVTEGGNASFTLTANPAPTADLDVSVTVSQSGDYGATTGQRTVTITADTASKTLTLPTTNDSTDEPDGSVTATLVDGNGYTVSSSQGAATVTVADDDDAPVDAPSSYAVDPEVVAAVQYLASQTHHGTAHVNRWQRTLVALDALDAAGVTGGAWTLAEARQNANTYSSPVWDQVVTELEAKEAFEAAQQTPPPTPEVSITSASSGTEGQPVTFTVSANPASAADLAVSATVATSGDYGVNAGARTVTITGGTTSKTLTLPTTDDSTDEPDGSVTLTLNTGNGYTLGQVSSKTAQVQDDDNPPQQQPVVTPVVNISGGAGVTEGGNISFTLTANPAPAADLTVSVTVSQSGDYGATTGSRTVTIPTTGSATLTIGTTNDSTDEADGSVTATLVDGVDYDLDTTQGAATVTVADDDDAPEDTSSYTVDPALIAEVQAHIDAFTARNHAAGIRDWNLILERLEGRTGMSDARIAAWLQNSTRYGWQDGIVTLPKVQAALAAMAAQQTQQTPPPTPEVNITAAAGGTEGSDVTFTVSANPAPAADLAVSATVATSGDYGVNAGARTVTITGGTTSKTLTLPTTDDSTDEPDGSVTLTLNTGNGYTLGQVSSKTAQVQDDDNPPQQQPVVTPVVSITGGASVTEGGNASFTLTSNPAPTADLDVSVTVSQSGDYGTTTGQRTVTITADTASKTLTLPTTDDSTDEPDGSVTATLVDGADYDLDTTQTATVSIADDDVPVISISGGSGVTEGGNAGFTITASPVPAADLTVSVTVSQSGDYGATTGSRTVTVPTTGSATLTIGTTNDSTDEPDGSVTATLVDGADYDLDTTQTATVSIADDDVPVVSISGGSGVTEGGNAGFTITASPVPAADLTVSVTVSQSGDYGATAGSRTVTVPTTGSATLTIGTTNDSTDEADGSVTVTLVDGADYDLGTNQAATVAVSDDDEASTPVSTVTISIEDASASESASDLVFRVTLSEASNEDVTVQWSTLNSQSPDRARGGQGYHYDYWHARGQIVIRAGETSGTGAVWLNQDSRDEPDEVFTVTLSSPKGATIERYEGTMTIIDDD